MSALVDQRQRWKPTLEDRQRVREMATWETMTTEHIALAMRVTVPTLVRHCSAELEEAAEEVRRRNAEFLQRAQAIAAGTAPGMNLNRRSHRAAQQAVARLLKRNRR